MARRSRTTRRSSAYSGTNPPNGLFPAPVHAALLQLPERSERLLGLGSHLLRGRQIRDLEPFSRNLRSIAGYLANAVRHSDSAAAEALLSLRDGAVAVALLRLVAAAVRQSPDERQDEDVATSGRQPPQIPPGNLPTHKQAVDISVTACSIAADILVHGPAAGRAVLVRKLLDMHTVHACASQLAVALAGCAKTPLWKDRAAHFLMQAMLLLNGMCAVQARRARWEMPYDRELVAALKDSHIVEHVARLLVQLMLTATQAEREALAGLSGDFVNLYLGICVRAVNSDKPLPSSSSKMQLAEVVSGPCADHVAMVLGLKTLCVADGGPAYGLPREVLAALPALTRPGVAVAALAPLSVMATAAMFSTRAGRLGRRAAVTLLLRVCRLAVASARASPAAMTPQGSAGASSRAPQPDTAVGGGQMAGEGAPWLLLAPRDGATLAVTALAAVWELLESRPTAWSAVAEEWWRLLLALCRAGEAARELQIALPLSVQRLGMLLAAPLHAAGAAGPAAGELLAAPLPAAEDGDPASLPPAPPQEPLAPALSAGIIPGLERLVRRAGEDVEGPEAGILTGVAAYFSSIPAPGWLVVSALLSYCEPRATAALVASCAKVLRRGETGSGPDAVARLITNVLFDVRRTLPEKVQTDSASSQPAHPAAVAHTPSSQALRSHLVAAWVPELLRFVETQHLHVRLPAYAEVGTWLPLLLAACSADGGGIAGAGTPCGGTGRSDGSSSSSNGDGDTGSSRSSSSSSWRKVLVQEIRAVDLLGAALRVQEDTAGTHSLCTTADACLAFTAALDEELRGAIQAAAASGAEGPADAGAGGCSAGGAAELPWPPALLRSCASHLRAAGGRGGQAEAVEALAALVEAWAAGRAGPEVDAMLGQVRSAAAPQVEQWAAAARLLPPPAAACSFLRTCANPRCTSLQGDSELGVRLQMCSSCGVAGYCCRQCQVAHWRAGHKAACPGRRVSGGAEAVTVVVAAEQPVEAVAVVDLTEAKPGQE